MKRIVLTILVMLLISSLVFASAPMEPDIGGISIEIVQWTEVEHFGQFTYLESWSTIPDSKWIISFAPAYYLNVPYHMSRMKYPTTNETDYRRLFYPKETP